MYKAVIAILAAVVLAASFACTHSDSRSRDEARQEAQEAKDEAKRAAEEAKQEAKEAGREAAEEGRAAAEDARRSAEEAKREADQARRDALNEAADARREARQQASDARREARESVREQHDDNNRDNDTSGDVVNLNSASAQEIASATGVTTNVAQKIVAARPYTSKRDLVSKKIIDDPTYWKIQKHVTVMSK